MMPTRPEFISALRREAFERLDVTNYVPDPHGWMCDAFRPEVRRTLAEANPDSPVCIIEVGSWKGRSTIAMAEELKNAGCRHPGNALIAVDTWLGAPEFWTWGFADPERRGGLSLHHGYPTVFYTFTRNVKHAGHDDLVAPFPISSPQGADVLRRYGFRADPTDIDASHEYSSVKQDSQAFWPMVKPGGSMLGDDYDASAWPGVVKAVDEYETESGLPKRVFGAVWSFRKPPKTTNATRAS